MSWTNERIELLQKLRLEGWSASRIAGELAHGITRNAVIGNATVRGLSRLAAIEAHAARASNITAKHRLRPAARDDPAMVPPSHSVSLADKADGIL